MPKEENISLTLPIPISVNEAYAGYRKRVKSDTYQVWQRKALESYRNQTQYTVSGDEWLEAEYVYYMPIFYKNGKKKVIDVFNYEKLLSDFLAKVIPGFHDHLIKKGSVEKIESDRFEVEIIIKEINS